MQRGAGLLNLCWVRLQVPVLNNAQMQACADGAAGSMQLWTRNYVLSSGTASISSMAQVLVVCKPAYACRCRFSFPYHDQHKLWRLSWNTCGKI